MPKCSRSKTAEPGVGGWKPSVTPGIADNDLIRRHVEAVDQKISFPVRNRDDAMAPAKRCFRQLAQKPKPRAQVNAIRELTREKGLYILYDDDAGRRGKQDCQVLRGVDCVGPLPAHEPGEHDLFPKHSQRAGLRCAAGTVNAKVRLLDFEFANIGSAKKNIVLVGLVYSSQLREKVLQVCETAIGGCGEPQDGNVHYSNNLGATCGRAGANKPQEVNTRRCRCRITVRQAKVTPPRSPGEG